MSIKNIIYAEGDTNLTREKIDVDAAYDAGTVLFSDAPRGTYTNDPTGAVTAVVLLDDTDAAGVAGALARGAKLRESFITLPADPTQKADAELLLWQAGISIYNDTGA